MSAENNSNEFSKDFEQHLEMIANEFRENLPNYSQIISIHHTDADGLSSGMIIKQMCMAFKTPFVQKSFSLKSPWTEFLRTLDSHIKNETAIIFSDLCPSSKDLSEFIKIYPSIHCYILDHHIFPLDAAYPIPDSVYNANPTQFGLNGLKQIAGATLNYLFAKEVEKKNQKLAWLAVLGMGGDVLDHFEDYQSYNRIVVEEAAELEQIEIHEGICAYGGMHEYLNVGLSLSILPFIPQLEGDKKKSKEHLVSIGIESKTKFDGLTKQQIEQIAQKIPTSFPLRGKYIIFPKKKGLFHYQFEHAQAIGLFGYDNTLYAMDLIHALQAPQDVKDKYTEYMREIVSNLTQFYKLPKYETSSVILANVTGVLPSKAWSDTASFATLNRIYDMNKILLLGGIDGENFKLSIRCSQEYLLTHNGVGANSIAKKITARLGGWGGGHPLAGGLTLKASQVQDLTAQIESILQS